MDERMITVLDENGNEIEFEVLLTFESDETGKKYVMYFDPEQEEPNVMTSIFDDEGNFFPVESQEEWDMIEEVFYSFMAEEEDEEDEEVEEEN